MAGEHVIVWRYRVAPEAAAAFERAYGPEGPWARLFGRHRGYRGTELVRGDDPGAWLTIDRWASADDFAAFLRESEDAYRRLDAELAPLTLSEELVLRGEAVERTTGSQPNRGGA